jgi:hypothetical protein
MPDPNHKPDRFFGIVLFIMIPLIALLYVLLPVLLPPVQP